MTLAATMAGITTILKTVTKPTTLKALASITDEPPADIQVFPTVIAVEDSADVDLRSAGTGTNASRAMRYFVGVHVLFAPSADPKMAYRERRPWLVPLIDLFQANPKLDGKVTSSDLVRVDFLPYGWNGVEYVAINFTLEVIDDE